MKKKIYLSIILHANMSYDRYTKQVIQRYFPVGYRKVIEELKKHPNITAHIDLSGVTIRMLQRNANDILDDFRTLNECGQIALAGCQYACSVNINTDERTTFESIRVGLEILRETLSPQVKGFFPQEFSYHCQLPWILRQLGVEWVILMSHYGSHWPVRVRGLDGTTLNAIANNAEVSNLSQLCEQASDGSFLLIGSDFETPTDLGVLEKKVQEINDTQNVELCFSTFPRWLAERGIPEKVIDYMPIGSGFEQPLERESFSRWLLKPLDIKMRQHILSAMVSLRRAELITGVLNPKKVEIDLPIEQIVSPAVDNPWDTMFEHTREFAEDEKKYLYRQNKSTALSCAYHHILIGTNSDAIGWASWEPRLQHRIGELERARILGNEIMMKALDSIASDIVVPDTLKEADRFFLAFNSTRARKSEIVIRTLYPGKLLSPLGEELPCNIYAQDMGYIVKALVAFPDYGWTLLGFKKDSFISELFWNLGKKITNNFYSVSIEGSYIKLQKGKISAKLSIPEFKLKDPTGVSPAECITPDFSQGHIQVRETLFGPQLQIFHETAWGVQTKLLFTLKGEDIFCDADFWFYQPRRIGESGWNPDGLRVELESPDKNGELWYSIPFGVIQHTNKDLSYVAMHRFAALQTNKGGMAFLPCSGVQGIRAIPSEGKLGLRLGASAEGELDAKPGRINKDGTLDTEYNRHSTGALFSGHYQHNFAIHLYEGDWRDANLSERGRQLQEPPIIKEVNLSIKNSNSRRAIDSLLKIEPRSVDIAGFRVLQGQREVVIYETHGQPANACLQLNGKQYKTKLQPWGISVLQIKE